MLSTLVYVHVQEESICRFCASALPKWQTVLTPVAPPRAQPTLAIICQGRLVRIKMDEHDPQVRIQASLLYVAATSDCERCGRFHGCLEESPALCCAKPVAVVFNAA